MWTTLAFTLRTNFSKLEKTTTKNSCRSTVIRSSAIFKNVHYFLEIHYTNPPGYFKNLLKYGSKFFLYISRKNWIKYTWLRSDFTDNWIFENCKRLNFFGVSYNYNIDDRDFSFLRNLLYIISSFIKIMNFFKTIFVVMAQSCVQYMQL